MPNYEIYWENGKKYETVTSLIPVKRYEKLRQFLHVSGNMKTVNRKTRTIVCIRPHQLSTVLGRTVKQYNQKSVSQLMSKSFQPRRNIVALSRITPRSQQSGLNCFVTTGKSGVMHDFSIYAGAKKTDKEKMQLRVCSAEIV